MGGVLLDGTGDIAFSSPKESLIDMVRTRLKADLDGWRLYRIGADLERRIGDAVDAELEIAIRRQATTCLQKQLLPPGSFTVKTVATGSQVDLYVYVNEELIATANINRQTGGVRIV
jgi:hypothetical protein